MSVVWNGELVLGKVEAAAMRGVATWIGLVDQRAVDLILSGPKTGRVYLRRGIAHQASAPGEAPASDTGTLVRNRATELIPERLAARLRFMAAHAMMMEKGTRNIAPRPFAVRALRETEVAGNDAVSNEIAAVLR